MPEDKYERICGRPRPTALSKIETDKFDLLANGKSIVVPNGALDAKKNGGVEEAERLLKPSATS